jgi:uncharacterized membrane protein
MAVGAGLGALMGKAVEGLRQFGGTVLKSSLSKDAEAQLQDALHGQEAAG